MKYTYKITVTTGDVKDAGTDAGVFISFYDKNNVPLLENYELDTPSFDDFERNSVGVYTLTTDRDYDVISKIRIYHDNTGKKPGWFLEKVSVRCVETKKEWNFFAHRWLSVVDDDGKTDITLKLADHIYEVTVYTGNKADGGTDANVHITLYGQNGTSVESILDDPNRNDFEQNNADTFYVRSENDLGKLNAVRIRHDNTGKKPGWFLQGIKVTHLNDKVRYYFNAYRWLSTDSDDGKLNIWLEVSSNSIDDKVHFRDKSALVLTKTKDARKAGTTIESVFKNNNISTKRLADSTYSEITKTISAHFANTGADSLSFIYIHSHGGTGGVDLVTDKNYISFSELKSMLDKIKGTKVLLLDTCYSGSAISSAFRAKDYHVLCASDEDGKDWGTNMVANIWNEGFSSEKKKDNNVTVQELYDYTVKELKKYKKHKQRAQLWSNNPDVVLFE